MIISKLSLADQIRSHWLSLYLRLPVNGVEKTFLTEMQARERFEAVRWPAGVACPRCGSRRIGFLEDREIHHCRDCSYQFSAKAGSQLHANKIPFLQLFIEAEALVTSRALDRRHFITLARMQRRTGCAYTTVSRTRKLISADLEPDGAGVLGKCICIRELPEELDFLSDAERLAEMSAMASQERRAI